MPDILGLVKKWVRRAERSEDEKYLPQADSQFNKAQSNKIVYARFK
jgi:hypothetical protein